ncbi:MAG: FmdE family protein [Lentihominibacter sp.]|jgi:formylmethanofuran dehydrogenase subunit E
MDKEQLWQKCVDFHGHFCGGLTIGYKAALYAIELLGLSVDDKENAGGISYDEEIVCIAENDACGCDAIQVILGCSIGKGNLLFHMRGKQAFSFYNRETNQSVRLILKPKPEGMTREQSFEYYQSLDPKDMFDVKETKIALPAKAKIFDSYPCESCGEVTGSHWIRIMNGKKVCLDCYETYYSPTSSTTMT